MQSELQISFATTMSSKPQNYLRTYRKRSSLGQPDLAFLLGSNDRAKVCRYEQGRRLPSLRTAMALATILDVSIGALFGDLQRDVRKEVARRVKTLRLHLERRYGTQGFPALVTRRLGWLEEHHGHKTNAPHIA